MFKFLVFMAAGATAVYYFGATLIDAGQAGLDESSMRQRQLVRQIEEGW